jgi:hypothetical protein
MHCEKPDVAAGCRRSVHLEGLIPTLVQLVSHHTLDILSRASLLCIEHLDGNHCIKNSLTCSSSI